MSILDPPVECYGPSWIWAGYSETRGWGHSVAVVTTRGEKRERKEVKMKKDKNTEDPVPNRMKETEDPVPSRMHSTGNVQC